MRHSHFHLFTTPEPLIKTLQRVVKILPSSLFFSSTVPVAVQNTHIVSPRKKPSWRHEL